MEIRVGFGYDVHQWADNRPLILGGVTIPHHQGLMGHSDADVLLHAITDALLGSLALGDIGTHFPDTDPQYNGADSGLLLQKAYELIRSKRYFLVNLDATVIMERPKLLEHIPSIRHRISEILDVDITRVSIKATTSEKMGFVGRGEGAASMATVLVQQEKNQ
jgi:2-C-methyl-D-erythritol 2,4-cyclodiphosphate synthase